MDEIARLITNLQNRLERIEKGLVIKVITIPSDASGAFIPKVVATDPASPKTNEIWINNVSHQLKWFDGSVTRVVTLT